MKEIYYICYHGDNFTKLNPRYKNGVTIQILNKEAKWYTVKETIMSPNGKDFYLDKGQFYSNTSGSIIVESDKHKIINIMFTTWETK